MTDTFLNYPGKKEQSICSSTKAPGKDSELPGSPTISGEVSALNCLLSCATHHIGDLGNSDYLVYWFSKKEMEKRLPDRLSDTDNNSEHHQSLRRIMSECDDNDLIIFINKLKM